MLHPRVNTNFTRVAHNSAGVTGDVVLDRLYAGIYPSD